MLKSLYHILLYVLICKIFFIYKFFLKALNPEFEICLKSMQLGTGQGTKILMPRFLLQVSGT